MAAVEAVAAAAADVVAAAAGFADADIAAVAAAVAAAADAGRGSGGVETNLSASKTAWPCLATSVPGNRVMAARTTSDAPVRVRNVACINERANVWVEMDGQFDRRDGRINGMTGRSVQAGETIRE